MSTLSEYERERQANIARNRALLEELDLKGAIRKLGLPSAGPSKAGGKAKTSKPKAKPIQPAKKRKRESEEEPAPRRQSTRLRGTVARANETPEERQKREEELALRRQQEEHERLEAEERAREAKKPRHQDLELTTMADDLSSAELLDLTKTLQDASQVLQPKRFGALTDFVYEDDKAESAEVTALRDRLQGLKIVSRAKVTQDRIYSAAYHPEQTKDLIFLGDKHGQLGIWDARAAPDEIQDEDGEIEDKDDAEGGKYWRLQAHWPATSKSSISCIKIDPIDAQTVYTSAYDCTIRSTSLATGLSKEVFSMDNILISSIDLPPSGNEMWISDGDGGLTHHDIRRDQSKARRWELAEVKIGCVSINPTNTNYLLTASNNRTLCIWDVRMLDKMALAKMPQAPPTPPRSSPVAEASNAPNSIVYDMAQDFIQSKAGKGTLLADWAHDKSVSSAYWDPRGRNIVSTSYDDTLRIWDVGDKLGTKANFYSLKPFNRTRHNCQTGKWLTILKAQWSPNPDVYPHFTIGNMNHSLEIFSGKGESLVRLYDSSKITAVQAVTCSHPSVVERAASGNASGRCVLWAPADLS